MDQATFDALSRGIGRALGRRTLFQTAVLVTVLPGAWLPARQAAVGKRKRRKRKKCRSPRVRCGTTCLPEGACCTSANCPRVPPHACADNSCVALCSPTCGECQRCDGGACVAAIDGTACTDGGVCRNSVCKPDRSLGCSVAQDSCGGGGGVVCPGGPNNRFCFLDADGDPVCGTALCTNDATGAECAGVTGVGSIVVPCQAICAVSPINKTHMCVKPIDSA